MHIQGHPLCKPTSCMCHFVYVWRESLCVWECVEFSLSDSMWVCVCVCVCIHIVLSYTYMCVCVVMPCTCMQYMFLCMYVCTHATLYNTLSLRYHVGRISNKVVLNCVCFCSQHQAVFRLRLYAPGCFSQRFLTWLSQQHRIDPAQII